MEENVLNVVSIVTIKDNVTLFKGNDPAINIEKIELEENDFPLVAQKGLYKPGDQAVYIQPDYNLPDIPLFESFIRPYGDPKKSILGSHNRIRAKKFAFHTGNGESIYSVGILLPKEEVYDYLISQGVTNIDGENLTTLLGVYKYEEPEPINGGKQNSGKPFPHGLYKTDEPNWNNVSGRAEFPGYYVGTLKTDGSSITIFSKSGNESGICSRNLLKPLKIKKCIGYRKPNFLERIKLFLNKIGISEFKNDFRLFEEVDNDDKFILLAKPYLEKLNEFCKEKGLNLALRGEANGATWKGSGNKNNPHAPLKENIKFFGVDSYDHVAVKLPESEFDLIVNQLGLDRCDVIFKGYFENKESLISACEDYFKNNLVEGIVIRSYDSAFSAKYMNLEYDSKK